MHKNNLSLIISRYLLGSWKKWLLMGLMGLMVAGVYIVIAPKDYEGKALLLVIQKYDQFSDALSASRASDRLTKTLATAASTSLFFEQIQEKNLTIGSWPLNETDRQKIWNRDVILKTVPDVSMIVVKTYRPAPAEALNLAAVVAQTLVEKGSLYHGGGDSVGIRIVDQPQVSGSFARPNVLLSLLLGFLIGVILAVVYLLMQVFFGKRHLATNFLQPKDL